MSAGMTASIADAVGIAEVISAKHMRRGFQALLALAEEPSGIR